MTPRRRLTSAVVLTVVAFAAMVIAIGFRMQHWNSIGWTGINYFPVMPKKARTNAASAGPGNAFLADDGRVIVAYPGAPGALGGISGADAIQSVNGIPIADQTRLAELDRTLRSGDVVRYHIRRGKTERDVSVRLLSPIRDPRIVASTLLSILLAISFTAIGLIVFVRRPEDRRAWVFYAMAIVGALSFLGGAAITFDGSNLRGIVTASGSMLVIMAFLISTFAFAAVTLHLSLVFPRDREIIASRPYVTRWIYVIPAAGALYVSAALSFQFLASLGAERTFEYALGKGFRFFAATLAIAGAAVALRIVRKARVEGFKQAFLSRPVQAIFAIASIVAAIAVLLEVAGQRGWSRVIFFAGAGVPMLGLFVYPILTFVALYRSYREAGVEEKRQVKWPLWGTMIALGVKILFGLGGFVIGLLMSMRLVADPGWMGFAQGLELLPRIGYLLIPISFAVAILKYRLMNIDVLIKKTVAYGILSGLIIAIYLVLVGGLGTVLVNVAGVRNQTMVIASTLVVALLFVPLRNRLQHLVDRNLFRQKYDYPEALKVLAAETLTARDPRAFHHVAAETLQQALQIRSVVIFERQQDELITAAKVGLPDSVLGSVRMDAGEAEAIDRPLNPKRRMLPEGTAGALRRVDTALAVPVRSQGTLHAVLALGPKLSDREFDLEDLEFLASAADQIGITVDRMRMQRDEEDFEQARAMQQSLMPATVPHVEGLDVSGTWKPARAVGGDYYDLLRLSDTQLAVCIGDVAGKGMPAALLMAALQATVRASAAPGVSPLEVCERVRRVIVQSLSGGRFVTFFYCTIDTAAKRVRYCNAGHNPPVLVRADGLAIRLDQGGSALSRLFSNTPFHQGEEEIREGDRLVLFTDGVSEARDTAGNDFSEERLEQIIAANRTSPAHDLIATILDSVSSFSGGRTDDDLTLVAVAIS